MAEDDGSGETVDGEPVTGSTPEESGSLFGVVVLLLALIAGGILSGNGNQ